MSTLSPFPFTVLAWPSFPPAVTNPLSACTQLARRCPCLGRPEVGPGPHVSDATVIADDCLRRGRWNPDPTPVASFSRGSRPGGPPLPARTREGWGRVPEDGAAWGVGHSCGKCQRPCPVGRGHLVLMNRLRPGSLARECVHSACPRAAPRRGKTHAVGAGDSAAWPRPRSRPQYLPCP